MIHKTIADKLRVARLFTERKAARAWLVQSGGASLDAPRITWKRKRLRARPDTGWPEGRDPF